MSQRTIEQIAAAMSTAVREFVSRELAPIKSRLASLEARPQMEYRGVWQAGEDYRAGDLVTHGGSMHYCWTATKERPGETDCWQLCVKRGAPGKDAPEARALTVK